MRLLIIAVLALLILGGGGAGAYFYFSAPAEAAIGSSASDIDAGRHPPPRNENHKFVQLDPLILPIIDDRGLTQVVSIIVVVEVENDTKADMVKRLSPRLKDAYIQDMYGVLNRHAAMQGEVIRVDILKQRLYDVSSRVLGSDTVEDVLLQVVQQRPL